MYVERGTGNGHRTDTEAPYIRYCSEGYEGDQLEVQATRTGFGYRSPAKPVVIPDKREKKKGPVKFSDTGRITNRDGRLDCVLLA